MKIGKRASSILSLVDKEKAYLLSIDSKWYSRIDFLMKAIILLLTIFLPILYLNLIDPKWFINPAVFEIAKNSYFALYKVTWVSHVVAIFLFIPSFLFLLLYFVALPSKGWKSFITLNSMFFYLCRIKKTLQNIKEEPLEKKIDILYFKFIKKLAAIAIIPIFFGLILLYFDKNNYVIVTVDGTYYKKYGLPSEGRLYWSDLKDVSSGCNYNLASYGNAFLRLKWYYKLKFKNNFSIDLYNFNSANNGKIDEIAMVNTIIKAFDIPKNYTKQKYNGFMNSNVSKERCSNYLKHNYSEHEYKILSKVLNH